MTQMNVPLTPDPPPENIETVTPPLSGDTRDDDGQALDDYFEPAYNGPVASEGYDLGVESTPKVTRILSQSQQLRINQAPYMALPPDLNRLHIRIVATVDIRIASDSNDVLYAGVLPAQQHWNNDYHTGAVWVIPSEEDGIVNIWAVTE